eukprot:m.59505 g.59505  ORF g.59505 m.59505 type:complete len:329 (-) comp15700_c0_seq1:247-1233(-)
MPQSSETVKPSDALLAGSGAGSFSRAVLQPLDVIKIKMQLSLKPTAASASGAAASDHGSHPMKHNRYHKSILSVVRSTIKHEGIRAMWKGHNPAQVLSIGYGSVQFGAYEKLNNAALSAVDFKQHGKLGQFLEKFVVGGIAGMCATTATMPVDTIRTRVVFQNAADKVYRSMWHAGTSIVRQEGVTQLYKGLGPSVVQIFPYAGLHFAYYYLFEQALRDRFPAGWINVETLVCGGLAGAVSKWHVLPMDMVKKRMQIQGFGLWKELGHPHFETSRACFCHIVRHEGPRGLVKGGTASTLKAVMTSAVTFWAYHYVLRILQATDKQFDY